jgi:hypothetical protein
VIRVLVTNTRGGNGRPQENNQQATFYTRLLAPPKFRDSEGLGQHSCVKYQCPLYRYASGIALEFGILFLLLCYVSTYTLHDTARLLARPSISQSGTRLTAVPVHALPGGGGGDGGSGTARQQQRGAWPDGAVGRSSEVTSVPV